MPFPKSDIGRRLSKPTLLFPIIRRLAMIPVLLTLGVPVTRAVTLSGVQSADIVVIPKGDHVLAGVCEVPAGKKLELLPGAVVTAEKGASLRIAGQWSVDGTDAQPVIFKGVKWAGIRTEAGATIAVRGLQVSGAEFALNIRGRTAKVWDCVFAKNVRGLKPDGEGEVLASNCRFVANTEYGLRFARMTGTIAHCTFFRNKGAGVVLGKATPRFVDCRFEENGRAGIEQEYNTGLEGLRCAFLGNGIAIVTGKKGKIAFRSCWWGPRITAYIRANGADALHPAIRTPVPEQPLSQAKKKKGGAVSAIDPEDTLRVDWTDFRSELKEGCGATVESKL